MVLVGEDESVCDVLIDEMDLNYASAFKYMWYFLYEKGIDGEGCCRKLTSRRKVTGGVISLVNPKSFQLQCARVVQWTLSVYVL